MYNNKELETTYVQKQRMYAAILKDIEKYLGTKNI